jgi:hypothetical protein
MRFPMWALKKSFPPQGMHGRSFAPGFDMPLPQISVNADLVVLPSAAAISSIVGFGTVKYIAARRSRSPSVHGSPPFSGNIDITRSSRST